MPAKPKPVANASESPRAVARRDEQLGVKECNRLRTRCGLESVSPAAAPTGLEEKTRGLESSLTAMRSQCETLESQLRRIEHSMEALQAVVTVTAVPSPSAAPQCPPAASAPKPQIRTVVVTEPIPWYGWLGLPAFGMAFAGALFAMWRKGIPTRGRAVDTIEQPRHRLATGATATNVVSPGDRTRNASVSTERPTPVRTFDKPAAEASSTVDIDLGTDSKASRAGLSEDVVREMERAIDGTRSIFTDVDRLIGLDRTQTAIGVLEFQIKTNPKDRDCWIKLMAIYRRAGKHIEFDKAAAEFKKNFPDGSGS